MIGEILLVVGFILFALRQFTGPWFSEYEVGVCDVHGKVADRHDERIGYCPFCGDAIDWTEREPFIDTLREKHSELSEWRENDKSSRLVYDAEHDLGINVEALDDEAEAVWTESEDEYEERELNLSEEGERGGR